MKLNKKYIFILFGALSLVSCKKSYLDKKPYTAVLVSDAIKSEADMATALNSAYSTLRSYYLFGASIPIKGDLMADNTFITTSNSGRYIGQNTFSFTNGDAYALNFWSLGYTAIKYANTVISAASIATTNTGKQYLGEAYATRALMHFELARNFAHPYTISPNDPGVPYVSAYDQNALPARGTVKDDYTKILADFEQAYGLMAANTYRGTAFLSKYAVRALEARVYQNMGDWANAKTAALDVISNSGWVMLAPTAYVNPTGTVGTSYANSTYNPGGYWGSTSSAPQSSTKNESFFDIVADNTSNNGFEQIGSLYLQAGGGYGDILATDDLYNQYSATDVRHGLIVRAPAGYRSGQQGNINLVYKYPNAFSSTSYRDAVRVIRLSDVILIAAEAYYNANDYTNANLYLNKVAQQRDPSFAGWSDTGAQVLEDILIERRKELAFEGQRLWDLVRLNRSWTKIRNQSPLVTIAASPSNNFLYYPIPLAEITANPNMTQNPGY